MQRYQKYSYIINNYQISKLNLIKKNSLVYIDEIYINSGHFKPNLTYVEHGLLTLSLTGNYPNINLFKHGKRLKNTILLTSNIKSKVKWFTIDNFINIFLPNLNDIKMLKYKVNILNNSVYSWRIRNFFEWDEYNILLTERILKKNVFLPIFFNIKLKNINKNYYLKQIIRMYKLPV